MFEVRLRPDTPLDKRQKIRDLERESDRIENWMYRITEGLGILVIVMLLVCRLAGA